MIKLENVPEAVWRKAMSTYHKTIKKRPGSAWQEAIAAALNAWPGMEIETWADRHWATGKDILLPIPQEKRDE